MAKPWGQHFLININVAKRIVACGALCPDDSVLEIGPGRGILTQLIVPVVKHFVGIEIDPNLAGLLKTRYQVHPGARIIQEDILLTNLKHLFAVDQPCKILANLPFGITAPILEKLMKWSGWSEAWLMVQREVGSRLVAKPNTKDYGILTMAVQNWSQAERLFGVSPGSFKPPPRVDSCVIHFQRRNNPQIPENLEMPFFQVVRAAFGQRRKTLQNALAHGLKQSKRLIDHWLIQSNIDGSRRAETLSIDDFLVLTQQRESAGVRLANLEAVDSDW